MASAGIPLGELGGGETLPPPFYCLQPARGCVVVVVVVVGGGFGDWKRRLSLIEPDDF